MRAACRTCHPRLSHPTGGGPTTPPCLDALLLLLEAIANNFIS